MLEQPIVLSEIDFVRLNKLLKEENQEHFDDVLEQADITNCACIPGDLVTMNTRITYMHLEDQRVDELRIVYPQDAEVSKNFISVLSPLGRAFLGRYEGDVVDCTLPSGDAISLKILNILYQPEAKGDFHL